MPRKRKQQPIQVPKNLPYGQGETAAAQQRAIPLPQAPPVPAPAGGSSAPPAGAVDPMALAIQAAKQMAAPGPGLLAPSRRPGEPVTAGLPIGPGPGPEILPSRLPRSSPNPILAELIAAHRMYPDSDLGPVIAKVRAMLGQ